MKVNIIKIEIEDAKWEIKFGEVKKKKQNKKSHSLQASWEIFSGFLSKIFTQVADKCYTFKCSWRFFLRFKIFLVFLKILIELEDDL